MSDTAKIRVTFWYEYTQESGYLRRDLVPAGLSDEDFANYENGIREQSAKIHAVYPEGQMEALAGYLRLSDALSVRTATLYDEGYGLTDEILDDTDVLIYWGHVSHAAVPDEAVERIRERIFKGMGFICLHSGHHSKTFTRIVGGSGTLHWREGEFCRIWTVTPTHPIARGIPVSFDLEEEEMYCEPFDVPKPDDLIFASWYRSGELFRSGMTWTRGYGKIFYFQPGHETSPSFKNEHVLKIIENAVFWAKPDLWREELVCVQDVVSAEDRYAGRTDG